MTSTEISYARTSAGWAGDDLLLAINAPKGSFDREHHIREAQRHLASLAEYMGYSVERIADAEKADRAAAAIEQSEALA